MPEDGYPTDEELARIKVWDCIKDARGLMEFVRSIWWQPDSGWSCDATKDDLDRPTLRYHLSTGGWSGNEAIISALKNSKTHFWMLYWQLSRRGGHYIFEIPDRTTEQPEEKETT